jgi:DNA polymerase-3 subunit beta
MARKTSTKTKPVEPKIESTVFSVHFSESEFLRFCERVQHANRVIPDCPVHPMLGNLKLVASSEGSLEITAFDMQTGIQFLVEAKVNQEGSILLPGKLFSGILTKFPSGEFSIDCIAQEEGRAGVNATLRSGEIRYQVKGFDVSKLESFDEYPDLPDPEEEGEAPQVVQIQADLLKRGLTGTLFSTGKDETKQILQGVKLKLSGKRVEFTSTDGHRLSYLRFRSFQSEDFSQVLPKAFLVEALKILGSEKEEIITIYSSKRTICLREKNYSLIVRLIEGQFPPVEQFIASTITPIQVRVDTKALSRSVSVLSAIGEQAERGLLKMEIQEHSIVMEVIAKDSGRGTETVSCNATGVDGTFVVGMNSKYLQAVINNIPTDTVVLRFKSAIQPILFTAESTDEISEEFIYLMMPIELPK